MSVKTLEDIGNCERISQQHTPTLLS